MFSRTARCDPGLATVSQCVPSEIVVPWGHAHGMYIAPHNLVIRVVCSCVSLSQAAPWVMCETGSVCVPRWHSITRLSSSVSFGGLAESCRHKEGPPSKGGTLIYEWQPGVLLHHTRGIEELTSACNQTARLSCHDYNHCLLPDSLIKTGLFEDSLLPFNVPERVVSNPRRHSSASCHISCSFSGIRQQST